MKCVDIFCGCGGLSLGFEKAGFDIVAAFDNWDASNQVYQKNFNHPIFKQDLNNELDSIKNIIKFKPDLIMGGPPCQDFSSAGKRDLSQGRADLTYKFANIVCKIKPKWFVMENVEQIKKSYILRDVIEKFKSANYGLTSIILDSSYCGVPQKRTRFFLIGCLKIEHNSLEEIYREMLSDAPLTIRDYFGDKFGIEYYYRHPRNYNRRGIFSIDEPSPTIRGVNRPIPKGYKKNSCDPKNADLARIRPLTTKERSLLQTFPEDFDFFGTKTNQEQMIGNAVPVNLGAFVATGIKKFIDNGSLSNDLFGRTEFSISSKILKK